MRIIAMTLVAAFAIGGVAFAGEEDCLKDCPTAQKVDALNAKWATAIEKMAAITPEQHKEFAAKAADVAKDCPVGCRLGETLATVHATLSAALDTCCADAESCPCEKLDPESEIAKEAKLLKEARKAVLTKLHTLASNAAKATGMTCASSCSDCGDCDEASKAECSEKADCGASCDQAKACPIRIASKIGGLRASYALAQKQVADMTPEARTKILVGFSKLAEQNAAVTLVPESVMALQEGFEGLNKLHGAMLEFAKKNPDLMKQVPEAARMRMMIQMGLLDEARLLLNTVTKTMKSMNSTAAKTAPKTASR